MDSRQKNIETCGEREPLCEIFLNGWKTIRSYGMNRVANVQDTEANDYVLEHILLWEQAGELFEAMKEM